MARRTIPNVPERPVHTIEEKRIDIEKLSRRISELEKFDPQLLTCRFSDPAQAEIQTAIEHTLSAVFGHGSVEYNRYARAARLDNGPIVVRSDWLDARQGGHRNSDLSEARRFVAEGKQMSLALLKQAIKSIEEEIELSLPPLSFDSKAKAKSHGGKVKVFVVHGRDTEVREIVARFLEQIGFRPVVLHEQANKGRTIITKFQEEAEDVGFAVILMTPDDIGGIEGQQLNGRARQNVVFELGFFIGALGSDRVATIVKGNIERPSDFDGVVYIPFDNGQWKIDLARELKAAGLDVDFNKVIS